MSDSGRIHIGMSPSGKAPDFDSGIRRFKSCHPSQSDPLAQLAEQLPFKQWVWSSNLQRVTKKSRYPNGYLLFFLCPQDSNHPIHNSPVDCWSRGLDRGTPLFKNRRGSPKPPGLFAFSCLHFLAFLTAKCYHNNIKIQRESRCCTNVINIIRYIQ